MGFFLFVWSILIIPMFLYFLIAAVVGFFSAKYQAFVIVLAGLVVAWMCIEFCRGEGLAPFAIYPTLALYALTTIGAIIASYGIERAYASDMSPGSNFDNETQA